MTGRSGISGSGRSRSALKSSVGPSPNWSSNLPKRPSLLVRRRRVTRTVVTDRLQCWAGTRCDWHLAATTHHSVYCLHIHTHPFNGPLSGTTRMSQYQKGKTNLDFTEARDIECQWHQLGHMQVCTSLQTDNHASTSPLSFYRPDALPATQPTVSMHWRQILNTKSDDISRSHSALYIIQTSRT